MAAAALLAAGGGLFQAFTLVEAGKQSERMSDYNAAIAMNNAIAAEQWASYNERQQRKQDAFSLGQMAVNAYKRGIVVDEGESADIVLQEQEIENELAALSIRQLGIAEARSFRSQAAGIISRGKSARKQANAQAVLSLIGGAGKATQLDPSLFPSGGGGTSSFASRRAKQTFPGVSQNFGF